MQRDHTIYDMQLKEKKKKFRTEWIDNVKNNTEIIFNNWQGAEDQQSMNIFLIKQDLDWNSEITQMSINIIVILIIFWHVKDLLF